LVIVQLQDDLKARLTRIKELEHEFQEIGKTNHRLAAEQRAARESVEGLQEKIQARDKRIAELMRDREEQRGEFEKLQREHEDLKKIAKSLQEQVKQYGARS
jgi:chromosome segregation ATPase